MSDDCDDYDKFHRTPQPLDANHPLYSSLVIGYKTSPTILIPQTASETCTQHFDNERLPGFPTAFDLAPELFGDSPPDDYFITNFPFDPDFKFKPRVLNENHPLYYTLVVGLKREGNKVIPMTAKDFHATGSKWIHYDNEYVQGYQNAYDILSSLFNHKRPSDEFFRRMA